MEFKVSKTFTMIRISLNICSFEMNKELNSIEAKIKLDARTDFRCCYTEERQTETNTHNFQNCTTFIKALFMAQIVGGKHKWK